MKLATAPTEAEIVSAVNELHALLGGQSRVGMLLIDTLARLSEFKSAILEECMISEAVSPDLDLPHRTIKALLAHATTLATASLRAENETMSQVLTDFYNELGCERDNEAGLAAIAAMQEALTHAEAVLKCLPDTSTNNSGKGPSTSTRHALALVSAAISKKPDITSESAS